MPTFQSRWLDWKPPQTPIQRGDKSDRTPPNPLLAPLSPRQLGALDGESASVDHPSPESRGIQKTPPKALIQRTAKGDKSPRPTEETWDGEMAELVRWFLGTHPPNEPFALTKAVVVLKPALWWTATRRDIAAGPNGPRARYGALQSDLRRLGALMKRE